MTEKSYTKLKELVGGDFTINEHTGTSWKKWNSEAKKMEVSQTPEKGYRKVYTFDTNEGILDLGVGQLGTLLTECFDVKSNLIGATFDVKSNGKEGMDIRYFFNIKSPANGPAEQPSDPGPEWA
jgi:hypothetical protein